MKTVHVVAAVIFSDTRFDLEEPTRNIVFAAERGYGEWKGWWEFPGGKIEAGESCEDALRREICEELSVDIRIHEKIGTVEYDYSDFHLSMECFECTSLSGHVTLYEHENSAWLTADTLRSVKWLPADALILPEIEKRLIRRCSKTIWDLRESPDFDLL